jgi:hypothetical protein
MATNKTTETTKSVSGFIKAVDNETKRNDSLQLVALMKEMSGFEPKMWGPTIIGFGTYHYKYNSGHEGDAPLIGFSPRKDAIVLYLESDFPKRESLLKKFGKHKTGASCVYVKKLADIDMTVLKEMVNASLQHTQTKKPVSLQSKRK